MGWDGRRSISVWHGSMICMILIFSFGDMGGGKWAGKGKGLWGWGWGGEEMGRGGRRVYIQTYR